MLTRVGPQQPAQQHPTVAERLTWVPRFWVEVGHAAGSNTAAQHSNNEGGEHKGKNAVLRTVVCKALSKPVCIAHLKHSFVLTAKRPLGVSMTMEGGLKGYSGGKVTLPEP